ncbi:phosphodiesterase [Shewanella waksmanii]|uniref:phosphodiesterase n=1 Tax=Shewanella waksmanii TaxID=213783 RepID=UPI0037367461
MLIAQLTDIHIGVGDKLGQPKEELRRLELCIDHINGFKPNIDLVLITGDLTEDGHLAEYKLLKSCLEQLSMPYFIIPGNHDRRQNLIKEFSELSYLPELGCDHVLYTIEQFDLRLIGLDTSLFGEPYGRLCSHRLDWLKQQLLLEPTKATLIFMHHPSFRVGIDWIDSAGLYGAKEFNEILALNKQIVSVVSGHVHRPVVANVDGRMVSCAPSVHQSIALSLAESNCYSFDYSSDPLSIHLHSWCESGEFVTHLSYISSVLKPSRAIPKEVKQRFKAEYKALYGEQQK